MWRVGLHQSHGRRMTRVQDEACSTTAGVQHEARITNPKPCMPRVFLVLVCFALLFLLCFARLLCVALRLWFALFLCFAPLLCYAPLLCFALLVLSSGGPVVRLSNGPVIRLQSRRPQAQGDLVWPIGNDRQDEPSEWPRRPSPGCRPLAGYGCLPTPCLA